MLYSLRGEREEKTPNASVAEENGLTSLFKGVRVLKEVHCQSRKTRIDGHELFLRAYRSSSENF